MTKLTKYLLALAIIILVVVAILAVTKQQGQPEVNKPAQIILDKNLPKTETPAKEELPPLPADSQQAIDKETGDLEKEIDSIDASLSTDTLSDSDLGL